MKEASLDKPAETTEATVTQRVATDDTIDVQAKEKTQTTQS
jgi:hypothetical protein